MTYDDLPDFFALSEEKQLEKFSSLTDTEQTQLFIEVLSRLSLGQTSKLLDEARKLENDPDTAKL